jgi:hypothetical protein
MFRRTAATHGDAGTWSCSLLQQTPSSAQVWRRVQPWAYRLHGGGEVISRQRLEQDGMAYDPADLAAALQTGNTGAHNSWSSFALLIRLDVAP